jgi:hypothetical protein
MRVRAERTDYSNQKALRSILPVLSLLFFFFFLLTVSQRSGS